MEAFIGIDVSVAKKKRCPISICVIINGRLIPLLLADNPVQPPKGFGNAATLSEERNVAYALATKKYILEVCKEYKLSPVRIGIDSPLFPKQDGLKRRKAELALDLKKISCFATPSQDEFKQIINRGNQHLQADREVSRLPHSMQLFMLAGFAIYQCLKNVAECIEVFPHATAKIIGVADKHKSKDLQPYKQLHAMSNYTGWPSSDEDWNSVTKICAGSVHDKVDAYGAAWVASLDNDQRVALGEETLNDAIYLPRLECLKPFNLKPLDLATLGLIQRQNNEHNNNDNKVRRVERENLHNHEVENSKVCPACGMHKFKRWPWGWDAHAAYKCTALDSCAFWR